MMNEAFGLVLRLRDARATTAARLGGILLDAGRTTSALQNLSPCLDRWADAPDGIDILAQMLRAHARLGLQAENVHGLIQRHRQSEALRPALEDMTRAFERDFELPMSEGEARLIVPAWSRRPDHRAAMSEYLLAAGNVRLRGGSLRAPRTPGDSLAALQRYAAAFHLNRSNAGASLAAAVLLASGLLRDSPRSDRLIEALVERLFVEKGHAYAVNDYPQIVRLHFVLAKLFEQRGQIDSARSPTHTVVFQLEHAFDVQARGEAMGMAMPAIPELHAWLARIYETRDSGAGRGRVVHQYLLAAREFARVRARREATEMLARAGDVPVADARLLAEVRAGIAALPSDED